MSITYLKVKIKSLAAESVIIRNMERKFLGYAKKCILNNDGKYSGTHMDTFSGLRTHRTYDVRNESRSAQLAYGYLRGHKYRDLERTSKTEPNIERVTSLIIKYGTPNMSRYSKDSPALKSRIEDIKIWFSAKE